MIDRILIAALFVMSLLQFRVIQLLNRDWEFWQKNNNTWLCSLSNDNCHRDGESVDYCNDELLKCWDTPPILHGEITPP